MLEVGGVFGQAGRDEQQSAEFDPAVNILPPQRNRTARVVVNDVSSLKADRMAKTVFYSFHYEQDVHRVQLVRNINALEGQPLLNSQEWEEVRRRGDQAIKDWIHDQMAYKKAVIVLIGKYTASRPWVLYEIEKAWADKKPLLGIRIHALSSLGSVDTAGSDPFGKVASVGAVPIFDPTTRDWAGKIDSKATYKKLSDNLERWSSQGATRLS
ncbi:TIR domain-containing protein [Streptomyces chartreusis]